MNRVRQLGIAFLSSEITGHWEDISNYLMEFSKKDKKSAEVNYSVHPLQKWKSYEGPTIPDGEFILQLRAGNHKLYDELAIISFDMWEDFVTIKQIQSGFNRDNHGFLARLKWERMLVSMISDWAFLQDIPNIGIYPAQKSNYWSRTTYIRKGLSLEEHQRNLKMRYDITARRSGFEYDDERKLWVKQNPALAA